MATETALPASLPAPLPLSFAAKGGIGKCTALVDCVAGNADDLMFLKVTLLRTFSFLHANAA